MPAGRPVAGATVVSAEGGLQARAVTDAAGAFTLDKQPEGVLHLVAATPSGGGVATVPAFPWGRESNPVTKTGGRS